MEKKKCKNTDHQWKNECAVTAEAFISDTYFLGDGRRFWFRGEVQPMDDVPWVGSNNYDNMFVVGRSARCTFAESSHVLKPSSHSEFNKTPAPSSP